MSKPHLEPTQASGAALLRRNLTGPVCMLNLLRLRDQADYSSHPELAPATPISGREAYERYLENTRPLLEQSGGELLLLGEGGRFLIGPDDERWDLVLLVKQHSVERFFAFASDEAYLAGLGHRTAAVEDSRLLPVEAVAMR